MRIAFFADLHIKGRNQEIEVDLGAASKLLAKQTQDALNNLNPDFIFGLGDLTASGLKDDWLGYKNWLKGVKAPVFDLFGNHDRGFLPFMKGNYALEYFTELGRVADTKVLKIANLIFILLSEEHNPEFAGHDVIYTLPNKRLVFLEKILKKYHQDHNVFVLSHSPVAGTTFFSDVWAFNDLASWKKVSQRYLKIYQKYPPLAHLTGHVHINYKQTGRVRKLSDNEWKYKVGKFVKSLDPPMYFLNLPCVDPAHGFFSSKLRFIYVFLNNIFKNREISHLYWKNENKGLPMTDTLIKAGFAGLTKSTLYYFDVDEGAKSLDLVTYHIFKQKELERYPVKLKVPVRKSKQSSVSSKYLSSGKSKKTAYIQLLASDLSIRTHHNLIFGIDEWFKINACKEAKLELSQSFSGAKKINKLLITAKNLADYRLLWKGSHDQGQTWTKKWFKNPSSLGSVNAVLIKAVLKAEKDKTAYVMDMKVI